MVLKNLHDQYQNCTTNAVHYWYLVSIITWENHSYLNYYLGRNHPNTIWIPKVRETFYPLFGSIPSQFHIDTRVWKFLAWNTELNGIETQIFSNTHVRKGKFIIVYILVVKKKVLPVPTLVRSFITPCRKNFGTWRLAIVRELSVGICWMVQEQAMVDITRRMVGEDWRRDGVRDVYADFNELTMEIVAAALFGASKDSEDMIRVGPAITQAFQFFTRRATSMFIGVWFSQVWAHLFLLHSWVQSKAICIVPCTPVI